MLGKLFSGGAADLVKGIGSVVDNLHTSGEEKLDNLRKHKEKYEGMTEEEQARFNEAWKNAGGKTKQVKKPNS